MAGYQFFAGVAAGVAMVAVPVVVLVAGPGNLAAGVQAWIDGPPPAPPVEVAGVVRPRRGYLPGDPTPTPMPVPTLKPATIPTPRTAPPQPAPPQAVVLPGTGLTWRAAVVRSGTGSVVVHQAAGVDSPGDPALPDGSPVLVGPGAVVHVGDQDWVSVRGLNNVVGWVPREVVVDGYAPPPTPAANRPATGPTPPATQPAAPQRARVANTDGQGVVLRASPRDEDRTQRGLLEGTTVTVLEWSGTDWVHVRADNGTEGWVPAKYLTAAD